MGGTGAEFLTPRAGDFMGQFCCLPPERVPSLHCPAASRGVGSWFTLKTCNAEERTLFCPGFNLAKDEWAISLIFFASLL